MKLDLITYPNWKARILRVVSRLLGLGSQHIAFIDIDPGGDIEYTRVKCQPCDGTGRLMTVTTYTLIDCPRCYGRG